MIAETCRLSGTIRTFDEETRTVMKDRLHAVTELTAATYGTTANIRYLMGYPPVVNDVHEASRF